ncbi:EGF-like domain-containing protein [Nephila pilipes]|uniref:EGF-like domain-containing protein n=1 Tax=Nephila pilipes TaxID=299642 RepID=A0A8X6TKZ2_NEPPI|nr:EGF-like domain-containing protein [Nephila pilipes]
MFTWLFAIAVFFLSPTASCKSNSDCENGGTCGKDQVCECKEGSSGDRCEIIKGCEKLACDDQISNCVLDVKAKKGMCECKEKTKLYVNHKCIGKCKVQNVPDTFNDIQVLKIIRFGKT